MLAVALLPLAALTGLVGADLTAVNQATVDEAHQTIVAEAAQRESSAATDGAATLQARLDALGGELGQLAGTVDALLRATRPATPAGRRAARAGRGCSPARPRAWPRWWARRASS